MLMGSALSTVAARWSVRHESSHKQVTQLSMIECFCVLLGSKRCRKISCYYYSRTTSFRRQNVRDKV